MHGVDPHHSAAVTVEAATPEHLRLLLDDVPGFESAYDLRVAPGYLEFDGALAHSLAALQTGVPARWWTNLFVHPADRALVGMGGHTGPPENGAVEIGYGIAPAYRGRGLATAAAAELIARTGTAGVRTVLAHTLAQANPSTGVLQALGFTRTAEIDSEDGLIWRWELPEHILPRRTADVADEARGQRVRRGGTECVERFNRPERALVVE